jgi:hypothetical protein
LKKKKKKKNKKQQQLPDPTRFDLQLCQAGWIPDRFHRLSAASSARLFYFLLCPQSHAAGLIDFNKRGGFLLSAHAAEPLEPELPGFLPTSIIISWILR